MTSLPRDETFHFTVSVGPHKLGARTLAFDDWIAVPVLKNKVVLLEPAERAYMNKPVTDQLLSAGIPVDFFSSPDEPAAAEAIAHANVIITSACPESLMKRSPRLVAIVNPYTGSEHIDVDAATRLGIVVGNGAVEENYIGMAEATVLLLLACFYNLQQSEQTFREHLPRPEITARTIYGKTVGVVGYGKIAQAFTARLKGWGIELLVSAPRLHAPLPEGARHVELEALLRQSDAIVLLCSLNAGTRNLVNRERLALTKHGAVVINTARGGIVDEAALAEMLADGRLRRVAIDAFETEPLPLNSPLRSAPNAILTPHMIGHNVEAMAAMVNNTVDAVRRSLKGIPPVHILNPAVLSIWRAARPT